MNATALSYGAAELKRLGTRYLAAGFLLSATIHCVAVVGLMLMRPAAMGTLERAGDRPWNPFPANGPDIHLTPPAEQRSGLAPGSMPPARRGVYVPVAVPLEEKIVDREGGAAVAPGPIIEGGNGGEGEPGGSGPSGPGGGFGDEPVPLELTEQLPQVIAAHAPEYPEFAVKAGLEGRIIVKMLVNRWGSVKEAEIESSTVEALNECALDAARQFIFRPAVMNNHPVSVWVRLPFVFQLAERR
jgi:TonB family protein